jgi:hypothetical protein
MMNPAEAGYGDARVEEFYRAARERVASLPGVAAAAWASGLPFWNTPSRSVLIEGAEQRQKSSGIASVVLTVDSDYLQSHRHPTASKAGAFRDSDDAASLCRWP